MRLNTKKLFIKNLIIIALINYLNQFANTIANN